VDTLVSAITAISTVRDGDSVCCRTLFDLQGPKDDAENPRVETGVRIPVNLTSDSDRT
jgi:hypothetical protein